MIKLLRFAVLLLGMALLFASCQKAPELTITSSPTVELNVDGSSGTITFTANRAWTVSSSDSWVTISPSSGEASDKPVSVTVRCNANTTYDDRTATVTIRMEDLSQSVTIKQPANKGVVLPKQVFDLQSDAKSIDIEVQANVQYTVSTSVDWIKQTGTKGLTSKTLTFSIEENKTYDPREGKITIKPQDSNVQEQVISVKQAQKDALNVEKTSYEMPYGGGEIEIKVEANVSFDVTPNADWIHYTQTKALSSSTVCLKIDENTTYSAREGKVEIKQQNGSLKHTITVSQAGRIAVTSVELNKTSLTMVIGDTETLTATVKPDNATDRTVIWTSSDTTVATVDETGKVTAIAEGTTTITAKAGEISATCNTMVYTNVQFEDANFKAYMVEHFDTNGDGEISVEEALLITTINVCTDNIASVKGIEYCTNLTTLICGGSDFAYGSTGQLTNINISKNTSLKYLNCRCNQLVSLDVSKNTALTYLECPVNQLTYLDLSKNTALTSINMTSNKVSNLDISNNTALTYLYCYGNQLSSLDVSNNTALTFLGCDVNQLTNLDVTNNTALEVLSCFANQLTSLDITNNGSLTSINCNSNQLTSLDVSKNTALTYLNFYGNLLTNLDVSNNTALSTLYCFENKISNLDISNNIALTTLDCSNNQLASLDVSNNTALTYFDCSPMNDSHSNNLLTTLYIAPGQSIPHITSERNVDYIPAGTVIVEKPISGGN